MSLFIRLSTSPRGAALRQLRWLLGVLVPVWLCLSTGRAAAATRDVAGLDVAGLDAASLAAATSTPAAVTLAAVTLDAVTLAAPAAPAVDVDSPGAEEVGAPMCDPRGASVLALPEVPEFDHGKLEQLPCDDAWLRWLGSTLEHAREQAAARDGVPATPAPDLQLTRVRVDGVLPLVIVMPERGPPLRLPPSEAAGLAARPGHRFLVYRPPVRGR